MLNFSFLIFFQHKDRLDGLTYLCTDALMIFFGNRQCYYILIYKNIELTVSAIKIDSPRDVLIL